MNAEEFAARRRADFVRADQDLTPLVKKALVRYGNGEADWSADLIEAAEVLWLEHFLDESPSANPDSPRRARFVREVTEALEHTDQPGPDGPEGYEVDRVTRWLGTFTVNDATWSAAGSRGIRNKRWTTMHDRAVRDDHFLADGQTRPIAAPFNVGGYELRFPGDPVGPPEIWINCRCVIQPAARRGEASVTASTFAIVDEADIAVEVADEEDLPNDDLEDDEEEITEIPVHGVLAPEGVQTGDGRMFAEGGLTARTLPLPIAYQILSGEGHGGSATVGRIDEVFRQGSEMRFRGALVLTKEHTSEVIEGIIDGTVRGISVDVDDIEVDMSVLDMAEEDLGKMPVTVFKNARVAGVTIVAIPAFQEAFISLGHEFADELSEEALAACAACADEGPEDPEDNADIELGYDAFRDFPAQARKESAEKGHALPDGSFPIENLEDLRNAIQAIGRAKDPAAAKAHIKKRARDLGAEDLIPEGWSLVAAGFAPGTHDGPGWITHPIPTARIRRYWVHGKGAAKIRWGVPGDFNRCRRQLSKYIVNPKWLAGACANMHKEAIKVWPGQELGGRKGHSLVASGEAAPIFTLVASSNRMFRHSDFQRVDLEDPRVGVVIEDDHIFGYVAQWGVCHIGVEGMCRETPYSKTDYWYFATGMVDTDQGTVKVGQITMDTGHAPLRANARVAAAHYDNTGAAVADVAVGEDDYGIWFSGVLRPGVTDDQRHALRASGRLSGDWREMFGNLELVAALAVNVGGLPIPHTLAASANGVQISLVAAGIVPLPESRTYSVEVGMNAEMVAGIARTAVAEYRHQERVAVRAAPLRDALRQKKIETLRTKIRE